MNTSVLIRIGSTADTAAIDRTTSALGKAEAAADDFVESIKAGVGIDIGGRIVNSIAQIPQVLKSAIDRGVEFNFAMGDAEIAIGNVIQKFQGLDKEAAKREAAKAMQQIIDLEPKAAGTLQTLVGGFMSSTASAQEAGVSISDNIELVGKLANSMANLNLPEEQLNQELRAIFSGNITSDSDLAKRLGITGPAIAAAKEAGTLVEYLNQKIGNLGDAGDSAAVRMSSMQSAIDKALGEFAKPISDELLKSFEQLTAAISSPEGKQELRELGFEIAGVVKTGADLLEWALKNGDALMIVAKGAAALGIALAAIKISQIVIGMGSWVASLVRSKVALDAETASLARNTAGQAANAAGRNASKGAGGFLGRPGNLAGAASLGVGIGTVGLTAALGYAAEVNAQSAKSEALGQSISKLGSQYAAAIKGASSVAEREEIVSGITADIVKLREQMVDASEEDAEMIVRSITLLEKIKTIAGNITDEKLNAAQADKEAATAAAEQAAKMKENAAEFEKFRAARVAELNERQQSRLNESLISGADQAATRGEDSDALRVRAEELRKKLGELPEITENSDPKLAEARAAERDKLETQIEQIESAEYDRVEKLAAAKKEADDKIKAERIKMLQEELAHEEAISNRKLSTIEHSGAEETKIAEARKREEDAIAAKRLAIENQIGALQGESAIAAATRLANYDAASIGRDASLARDTAPDPTFDQSGTRGGRRVVGTDGSVLRDASGTLGNGVAASRLGTLSTPLGSMLGGPSVGPVALRQPRITPGGALNDPRSGFADGEDGSASEFGASSARSDPATKFESASSKTIQSLDQTNTQMSRLATVIESSGNITAGILQTSGGIIEKTLAIVQSQQKLLTKVSADLNKLSSRVTNL